MPEILHEEVLVEQGLFRRVRQWWRGQHPQMGLIQPPWMGWSGDWETVVVVDRIMARMVFTVVDKETTLAGR